MVIRDFQEQDRRAYLAMSEDFYRGDAALFAVPEEHFTATFDAALAGSPLVRALMLEEAGAPVGYALLAFYWSCEAGGPVLILDELYLAPQSRGKKLGSAFLEWLLAEYEPRVKRFRLEVCPKNARVAKLYETYGFKELEYRQMFR